MADGTNPEDSLVPSTPPNTTADNQHTTANPPKSNRRESTRLRTPCAWPGFVPTKTDSRRALTSNTPAAQPPRKQRRASSANHHTSPTIGDAANNEVQVAPNPLTGVTQVAQCTGRQVVVELAQDSDEDNTKASKGGSKKDPMKDKDGYDHCRLFFFPPGKGPEQDPTNQAWACRWCPKEYIASGGSYYNLKAH
ncbi:hypothetical protein Pst134EA_013917 [Puccinia striiformis f. sp. tritici]|uniref:hypothetical protein n=1 Tax=Puccinia striiformis f. sp. tritici TaxID=168172 RepID=UPI002008115C|nr:hypothetical protein Pst134EA_013917 [Puccinia striiformis f. sp. tritici]KAH9466070.1 hypothetical protein Pst134EA_013917 [Puccinia striiformis f. sp. tritici]